MQSNFKFFAWNIDQARREEEYIETQWNKRSSKVKELIQSTDSDIIALIELRDLKTSEEHARKFLSDPCFHKYNVVLRHYCHFEYTFQMALLYKPSIFFAGDVRVHNFINEHNNDKMVMFVDLQSKETMKWFTIGVTHFDLPEDIKWTSTHILRNLIMTQKYPCIVYGDYNFFNDRDGIKQRNFMLEKCIDLAYPLYDKNKEKPLSGTFIGFPHDNFKQSFDKMSRLDHIFTPKIGGLTSTIAISPSIDKYLLDNTNYETYNYPSDHLALCIVVNLPKL